MAVRIVNDLMPDEEGIVFDFASEAETVLACMIADYERRGFSVTERGYTEERELQYLVLDRSRRPHGLYSIKFEGIERAIA